MKISNSLKVFSLTMALLISAAAFASNKGSVIVGTSVMVNGKQLQAGNYSVQWEGNGPDVQVSFLKGKNVVATAPAHLIDLNASPANDAALIKKNDDGTNSLAQIRFGGKRKALSLDVAGPQS